MQPTVCFYYSRFYSLFPKKTRKGERSAFAGNCDVAASLLLWGVMFGSLVRRGTGPALLSFYGQALLMLEIIIGFGLIQICVWYGYESCADFRAKKTLDAISVSFHGGSCFAGIGLLVVVCLVMQLLSWRHYVSDKVSHGFSCGFLVRRVFSAS